MTAPQPRHDPPLVATVLLLASTASIAATCVIAAVSHTWWVDMTAVTVGLALWLGLGFAAGAAWIDDHFDRRERELGLRPPTDPKDPT